MHKELTCLDNSFKKLTRWHGEKAGKITGMILELDLEELIRLV